MNNEGFQVDLGSILEQGIEVLNQLHIRTWSGYNN